MKKVLMLILTIMSLSIVHAKTISNTIEKEVIAIGNKYNVPESVVRALMYEESRYDDHAIGKLVNGYRAKGLFQIYTQPKNLEYLIWKYWNNSKEFDIFNPLDNAEVALHYLSDLHKFYKSWYKSLVFYNCGYTKDIPKSTHNYAIRIISAP